MKKNMIAVALAVFAIAVLATGCRSNGSADLSDLSGVHGGTPAPISNTVPTTQPRTKETVSERVSEDASSLRDEMHDKKEDAKKAARDVADGVKNAGKDMADGMKNAGRELGDTMDASDATPGAGITDRADEMKNAVLSK